MTFICRANRVIQNIFSSIVLPFVWLTRNEVKISTESTHMSDYLLSAEEVANNIDLLTLILLRVPATSLIRFRCISKHWISIISSSKFSNDHTRQNSSPSFSGLFSGSSSLLNFNTRGPNGQQSLPTSDFLNTSFRPKPEILHSCNGLMLCSRGPQIIVCNLTTQKFKVICLLSGPSLDHLRNNLFIDFYPTISSNYRVVLVRSGCLKGGYFSHSRDPDEHPYDIDIYSSERGIWKTVHFSQPFLCGHYIRKVFCGGAIYWMDNENNLLHKIDIDEENLTTIRMPFQPLIFPSETRILWFGEYAGSLSLILTSTSDDTMYRILEMDMQSFKWNIKYDLKLGKFTNYQHCSPKMLCFKAGDGEKTPTLLLAMGEKVVSCNLKSSQTEISKRVSLNGIESHRLSILEQVGVHKFVESMAPI